MQEIYSLDGEKAQIFPSGERVEIVTFDPVRPSWKVRTESSLYIFEYGRWSKNPRFTDYIDISPRYRLGYIDVRDRAKLVLQSLPTDAPVFLLLDRESNKASTLKSGVISSGLYFLDGHVVTLSPQGAIEQIDII
jgi:hypothetical protein